MNNEPIIIIDNYENEKLDKMVEMESIKSDNSDVNISLHEDDPQQISDIEQKIVFDEEEEKIRKELEQMSPLHLPGRYFDFPESFDSTNADKSYVTNSNHELLCLDYIDNFIRQYKLLCKDRKYLLLAPNNEYNVRKYICTYIKPTEFKYSDFYYWNTAAKYISDYLDFIPVVPSTEVPKRVLSSSLVLKIRKGTCFEYSNLLCSLLLGVGYDAYVVSGYATRECCYIDQSRTPCPFVDEKEKVKPPKVKQEISKYLVKPPKDLKSKYELYEEARKIQNDVIEKEKLRLKEEEEIKLKEKPPPDPLFGLRVHCWVLIKAHSRDITEDFFIEPLTGQYVPLKTDMFNGVESMWNNVNCWINTQDCSQGIEKMEYNPNDRFKWELVFITDLGNEQATALSRNTFSSKTTEKDTDDEIKVFESFLKIIESPPSWIKRLTLSLVDYERKYPSNKKQIIYYKIKCLRYSPYYNQNGLIMQLLFYSDMTLTELIEERNIYEHRSDKLYMIVKKNNWTIEYFLEGSNYNLKEHHFRTSHPQPESERILIFYHKNNVDGLVKKEETPFSLKEYYEDRLDHLIYMECTFTKRAISFASEKGTYRNIEKIVKQFSRNHNLSCTDNVAEMILFLNEDRILITYHVDEFNFIPNTLEYLKPAIPQDGKNIIPFYNDTHYHFKANSFCREDDTKLKIYQYLLELFANEKKCKDEVRWSENQTKDIVLQRKHEGDKNNLEITLYDTIRNTVATKLRIELETSAEMERNKLIEDELDYLTPYLLNQNINDIETKEEAFKIREECLMDFKLGLIYKANIVQSRYDDETAKLQKKQLWYYQNQSELSKEDEEEYIDFCTKASFTISNLENMLNRHKQSAPRKYIDLEHKLRNDARMKKFLNAL